MENLERLISGLSQLLDNTLPLTQPRKDKLKVQEDLLLEKCRTGVTWTDRERLFAELMLQLRRKLDWTD